MSFIILSLGTSLINVRFLVPFVSTKLFKRDFCKFLSSRHTFAPNLFPFRANEKVVSTKAKLKYKTFEWILLNHVKPHDCPAQNTRLYYYLYTFCNNHFASIFGYKTQPIFHKFSPTCLRMERYLLKLKIKRLS